MREETVRVCLFEDDIHDQNQKQLFEMFNLNKADERLAEKVLDLA